MSASGSFIKNKKYYLFNITLPTNTPSMISLIPVMEVLINNRDIQHPELYPYWKYPDIWDEYHSKCYKAAGFNSEWTPYHKGSVFYKTSDISDELLTYLTLERTLEFRLGLLERKEICAFWGGYVLNVKGNDIYFPQCCGELSDIKYWDNLSKGIPSYYEGHPSPEVSFKDNSIVLDFNVSENDEHFSPTPPLNIFELEKAALQKAVTNAKATLATLQLRLENINTNKQLNIDNIGGMLIWDNLNYPSDNHNEY